VPTTRLIHSYAFGLPIAKIENHHSNQDVDLRLISSRKLTLVAILIPFSILSLMILVQLNNSYGYLPASTDTLVANPVNSPFLTYQKNGIVIDYPSTWHIKEIGGPATNNITDIVSFSPPNEATSAEVMVSFDNSVGNESLTGYLSDIIASGAQDNKDFKLINANTISTISGNPAYSLQTSYVDGGTNYQTLETGIKIDNKVYFISYDVESSNYATYLPSVQKIIESFKVMSIKNL
jgi:PsbP-like protein